MDNFEEKILVCQDCGLNFEWTEGEQIFLYRLQTAGKLDRTDKDGNHIQGEVTPPKRCPDTFDNEGNLTKEGCRTMKKKKYQK